MSGTRSADRIEGSEGRQYHIGLAPGEVAPRIVLVGDPERAKRIAGGFDEVRVERSRREYVTFTGTKDGLELTVMATGMGCDNTEIAVYELLACVERPTLLRIGSSGGLQADMEIGDLVISTGAVRLENTSLGFAEPGYPAVAHHEMVLALQSAAHGLGAPHHLGVTATAPGFYGWQGREGGPIGPRDPDLLDRLARQGVRNMEMEASTLFTMASVLGLRAGAVCALFANRPRNAFIGEGEKQAAEDRAIAVGLEALRVIEAMDARAGDGPFVVEAGS